MKRTHAIAIDGPAGSGKSTIAKKLAERLGYLYIDTGAMYRSATLSVLQSGIDPDDERAVTAHVSGLDIALSGSGEDRHVLLNGRDVTRNIRQEDVSNMVSRVARIIGVRAVMVDKQRDMARHANVVMDGRDIGTHVLPDADYKFFLTASLEERARRRQRDFLSLDEPMDLSRIMKSIEERDQQDSSRKASPLRQAQDAIAIDTTHLTVDQVLDEIERIMGTSRKGFTYTP